LVGAVFGALRLVAAPFLAAADLADPPRPVPAERRALFPFFDPVDPLRAPDPAPRPPLPLRLLAEVPPLRLPDRPAVVRAPDPAPAEPARAPPGLADDPPDLAEPEPRLAPRGGTLGRITSGDSSL
jgi:hypothetical protein